MLQELHPDAPCLPEHTAKLIVEYGETRLQKSGVDSFVSTMSSSSSSATAVILTKSHEIAVTDRLGQGSFSTVYQLANHKDHAVKVLKPKLLKKPTLFAGCAADLVREGILLSHLSHPNLLKCHAMGSLVDFSNGRHDACALLLERLDITLKDQLTEWRNQAQINMSSTTATPSVQDVLFVLSGTRHRRLRQTLLQRTDALCQLADAIQFLHAHGIMHRDLKPDNIGFVGATLKVFDLDICRILPKGANHSEDLFHFTKHVGSPRYMAPEVARGERYNTKADIYAFGLLAYELLSLQKAYHDIPSDRMEARVCYQGARPSCPSQWPRPVAELITKCWTETIGQRPTMVQVVEELRETMDQMCPLQVKKRRQEQQRIQQQQQQQQFVKRVASEDSGRTYRSDTTLEGGASQ